MTKKFGFTLAEVLITLGIIGVVAAMTIPTLMNQTGQAEFKTGFKKAVSVLNQAITMNVALETNDFSALSTGQAQGSVYYMFKNRMNVIRDTTATTTALGTGTSGTWPFASGSNYTMYLNDGMVITFPTAATSCTTASLGNAVPTANCRIVVDVNGAKKPNKLSTATTGTVGIYDQYVLDFYNQQVVPHDEKAKYVLYN